MDSTDQIEKKICSMCHHVCMDRVSLPCGHHFCRLCMERVLDVQDKRNLYYCPECSNFCQVRPLIKQETILCPWDDICCTYCDLAAMKTCVQCDSQFCATHLIKHPSLPGHTLIEPTLSLDDRKCSTHKEILKYYCTEEGSCICTSCCVAGDHKGHQEILLHEFAEQKKRKLRRLMESFKMDVQEAEKQIYKLQANEQNEKQKADEIEHEVMAQIENLKRELSRQQAKVLSVISQQKKMVSLSASNQIRKLKAHKSELSRGMERITELCAMEDPLTFLRSEKDSNLTGNFSRQCNTKSGVKFDATSVSQKLHKKFLQFADGLIDRMLKDDIPKMKKCRLTLDNKTAHYNIAVTSDLRSASYSLKRQRRESNKESFRSRHVLSKHSFSSGNHYWEVDVIGINSCIVGVACRSMDRKTSSSKSLIGFNRKSWSLCVDNVLSACHNCVQREIPMDSSVRSFGIFLEYEAGRLSFYQLCDPIRHLHTFTTIFTEPLHAAFYLNKGCGISIRK